MRISQSMIVILVFSPFFTSPLLAQFQDVPADSWYKDAVTNLYEMGVVEGYRVPGSGYSEFRPFETVTRAEFLKMSLLVLLKGNARNILIREENPTLPPFPDVPVQSWSASYVDFAREWEIIDGSMPGFMPDAPITREDAALWVFETMNLFGELKPVRAYREFEDIDGGDSHIEKLYKAGIVEGYSATHFRPNNTLNRAEAAVLINRAYQISIYPSQLELKLTAFTPDNPFLEQKALPRGLVVGIRLNNPGHEKNFIQIKVDIEASGFVEGVRFYLRQTQPGFRLWAGPNSSNPLLLSGVGEVEIPSSSNIWVENTTYGLTDLYLEARSGINGEVICSDKLKLETFKSIVVILGGRNQDPATYDPEDGTACSDNLCGVFDIGSFLYNRGYDVRLFDEDKVAGIIDSITIFGSGDVYDEIKEATEYRGVTEVSVVGYSHGGGSTWSLVTSLGLTLGGFSIPYTAYIDAVIDFLPFSESGVPCVSLSHDNYFHSTSILDGNLLSEDKCGGNGPLLYQKDMNKELSEGQTPLDHLNIDDSPLIHRSIIERLIARVARTASDNTISPQ